MNKRVIFLLCVFVSILIMKNNAYSVTYDIKECVQIGIANSYNVKKQENNIKYCESQTLSSYGSFLPDINIGINYYPFISKYKNNINIAEEVPGLSPAAAVDHNTKTETAEAGYYIKSTLDIFDGFKNINKIKYSVNEEQGNKLILRREKEKVIYTIVKNYYQLMLDSELYKIAGDNLDLSESVLKKIKAKVQLGDLSKSDQYQQETKVYENKLLCIKRKNEIVIDKVNIMSSMGILGKEHDVEFKEISISNQENKYPDKEDMISIAMKNRTDYIAKDRLVAASKYSSEMVKSDLYPKLSFVVQINKNAIENSLYIDNGVEYALSGQKSVFNDIFNDVSVMYGLEMSWNIFNGFETSKNIQKSKMAYLNSIIEKEEIKDQIITEIQKYIAEYETAIGRADAADASVKSSSQAYAVVYERYNNGFADYAELSESNTSMLTAKSERAQAIYNLEYLGNIMKYYTGTIDIEEYML